MTGKIILVSGPCGSGKTTVSRLLSNESKAIGAVHMHTDDFYSYIKKGYIEPWMDGSGDQNETVICAAAACACTYAKGGYEVYVDGVIGPWFIEPWKALLQQGADVRYVVLRPGCEETVHRGLKRKERAEFPLTEQVFRDMWEMFSSLGDYESYVINTETMTEETTAAVLREQIDAGGYRLQVK